MHGRVIRIQWDSFQENPSTWMDVQPGFIRSWMVATTSCRRHVFLIASNEDVRQHFIWLSWIFSEQRLSLSRSFSTRRRHHSRFQTRRNTTKPCQCDKISDVSRDNYNDFPSLWSDFYIKSSSSMQSINYCTVWSNWYRRKIFFATCLFFTMDQIKRKEKEKIE